MHFLINKSLTSVLIRNLSIAYAFAIFDINARFRRSILGTFWYTLSTAIVIFGLGPLYAKIFNHSLDSYFQYIAYGIILWNFIQGTISDSTSVYISNQSYIKDLGIHVLVFSVASVLKNLLIFIQNLLAVIIIFLLSGFDFLIPTVHLLFILLTQSILLIYVSFVIALVSTRFRDVAPLINVILQLLFFLTPILWMTRYDLENSSVILFNPIFHMISLPRELLLFGTYDSITHFYIIVITIPIAIFAEVVNLKYTGKAIYWL